MFQIQVGKTFTTWKKSKYGVFSGPYFPVFTPYLDNFQAVNAFERSEPNKTWCILETGVTLLASYVLLLSISSVWC